MLGAVRFFLEVELRDGVGLGPVGQAGQKPRHRQAQVAGVVRFAERPPGGVFGRLENLGQVAAIAQLLPGIHLHQRGRLRR